MSDLVERSAVLDLMRTNWADNDGDTAMQLSIDDVRDLPTAAPVEDAVSRETLLDGLASIAKAKARSDAQKALMGRVMFFTEQLPPVNPKQKWIPVDYDKYPETYPKAFQEVWITDAYGEVYHRAYDGTRSVKAWMPYIIPEPYKKGESE